MTERERCGAKTRYGGTCKSWPIKGSKRCRMHGGGAKKGADVPVFKGYTTARRRKAGNLPERMQEAIDAADRDRNLASLREDIVILDARIVDLTNRVDSGESGKRWSDLRQAMRDFRRFRRSKDEQAMTNSFALVEDLVLGDTDDFQVWEEIMVTMDRRRKLLESERKRLLELKAVIPADRARTAIRAVLEAVREEVLELPLTPEHRKKVLERIGRRAYQVMNMPGDGTDAPPGVVDIEGEVRSA